MVGNQQCGRDRHSLLDRHSRPNRDSHGLETNEWCGIVEAAAQRWERVFRRPIQGFEAMERFKTDRRTRVIEQADQFTESHWSCQQARRPTCLRHSPLRGRFDAPQAAAQTGSQQGAAEFARPGWLGWPLISRSFWSFHAESLSNIPNLQSCAPASRIDFDASWSENRAESFSPLKPAQPAKSISGCLTPHPARNILRRIWPLAMGGPVVR